MNLNVCKCCLFLTSTSEADERTLFLKNASSLLQQRGSFASVMGGYIRYDRGFVPIKRE